MIHYQDDSVTLIHGDCIEQMRAMPDASIDAIVTDPPYGLGFMGKAWDDLPPGEDWARECLRVLKPGGHLLAFGGTRTWHRLAVAVEDAGFEMRDSIAWLYGSGFPKSLDVSKAIDKAAGAEREVVGRRTDGADQHGFGNGHAVDRRDTSGGRYGGEFDLTAPATDAAQRWQGWGTALKPAFEPIVVGRKPLVGTVAANVLAHGTGALNIDATRIGTDGGCRGAGVGPKGDVYGDGLNGSFAPPVPGLGRWPANVVLSHEPECVPVGMLTETVGGGAAGSSGFAGGYEAGDGFVGHTVATAQWKCAPGCQVAALDAQSGVQKSGTAVQRNGGGQKIGSTVYSGSGGGIQRPDAGYGDTGGASRFFYCAKAPTRERVKVDGVAHPTVKPLALMRWLIRLVTPPGGVVLEPFAGSGTTVEAAVQEGVRVVAIEREASYLPLTLARLDRNRPEPEQTITIPDQPTAEVGQGSLFEVTA